MGSQEKTTEGMRMTQVHKSVGHPVPVQNTWAERWEGPDRELICLWVRGIEKARETPTLREMALRGELPPLAWKGGSDKALKTAKQIGSLHYLAAWQGLRRDDLNIDTDAAFSLTRTRFQTVVTFTDDIQALALTPSKEA